MDGFERKSINSSRGHTWTYHVSGNDTTLPVILMIHGWPDHARMWSGIVAELRKQGISLPIIVPDMLGYDGTSKPIDEPSYTYDKVSGELIEIINAEGFQNVISTGHDWGSAYAQRLYNYFPERVVGLIMLNAAYMAPSKEKFDLDAANALTEKHLGYPAFAYWHLFADPQGPELLKARVDRVYSALHAVDDDAMKDFFCVYDGFKNYILANGEEKKVRHYAQSPAFKEDFISRMKRDGFDAPQCYYRAARFGYQDEGEAKIPADNAKVNVPALYIGCTGDPVCTPTLMQGSIQAGLLPDLEGYHMIESGHWCTYEKPEEVGQIIAGWLSRKLLQKAGQMQSSL